MNEEPEYSIQVYKDYAIIKESIPPEVLNILVNLGKIHGFTKITFTDEGKGFKFI